jgi:hypothetical protein
VTTDPNALIAHGYAAASLLGSVTLRVAPLDGGDYLVVDHRTTTIWVRPGLTPQQQRDALAEGLRLLCAGETIVVAPDGTPAWNRAVGDCGPPPPTTRLRVVR